MLDLADYSSTDQAVKEEQDLERFSPKLEQTQRFYKYVQIKRKVYQVGELK